MPRHRHKQVVLWPTATPFLPNLYTYIVADQRQRVMYGRAGAGAFTLMPLSHETYGQIDPAAFAFLNRLADVAAGSGNAARWLLLESVMCDLASPHCWACGRSPGPRRYRA